MTKFCDIIRNESRKNPARNGNIRSLPWEKHDQKYVGKVTVFFSRQGPVLIRFSHIRLSQKGKRDAKWAVRGFTRNHRILR
jgi:hypothetical protein